MPALTRIYSPDEMGRYQIAFAVSVILSIFLTLRMEYRLPALPRSERQTAYKQGVGVVNALLLVGLVCLMAGAFIDVASLIGAVFVMACAYGLTMLDNALLGEGEFSSLLARRNVLSGLVTALGQVAGGLIEPHFETLVLAFCGGRIVSILATRNGAFLPISANLAVSLHWPKLYRAAGGHSGLVSAVGSAVSNLAPSLPIAFSTVFLGAGAAGQLALAQRAAVAPISFLGVGLAQYVAMAVGTYIRDDRRGVLSVVTRQLRRTVPLGVVAGLAIAAFGKLGFVWVFGSSWESAGESLIWLAPALGLQLTVSPMVSIFSALGAARVFMSVEVLNLVVMASALTAGALVWEQSLTALVVCASGAMASGQLIVLVALLRVSQRWDATRVLGGGPRVEGASF